MATARPIALIVSNSGRRSPRSVTLRVPVYAALLLAAAVLLLAGADAHARAAEPVPDRLRITAKPDPTSPASVAVMTATGTVGRRGDTDATTLSIDMHAGTVIVTAIPRI